MGAPKRWANLGTRLEMGRNSLTYRRALLWNSIPDYLKRAPSLNIFKKLIKNNRPLFQTDKIVFSIVLNF